MKADLEMSPVNVTQGGNSVDEIFCLSFALKNGLRFHLRLCDMSKLPIFELFISVGNLKPKLKWIFKLKLEQKNTIELSPGQTWSHSLHLAVEDGATLKVSEAVYD